MQGQIENSEKMVLEDDLKCMKRVLRRLEFTNKDDIVQIKGKVACDISACDEIMITELMFSGLFNEMESNEIAALLSSLVHDESPNAEKTGIKQEKLQKKNTVFVYTVMGFDNKIIDNCGFLSKGNSKIFYELGHKGVDI